MECSGCKKTNINCSCCNTCKKDCSTCSRPGCTERICDHKGDCKKINDDWKHTKNGLLYKNGKEESYGYVYMIQSAEDWNTKIIKIGRTTHIISKKNSVKRFDSYPDYSKIIVVYETSNSILLEKTLLEHFRRQFTPDKGNEWFKGDISKMKEEFLKVVMGHI
jgi:hypothetical protein